MMTMTNSLRQVLFSVAALTMATVLLLNREQTAAVLLWKSRNSGGGGGSVRRGTTIINNNNNNSNNNNQSLHELPQPPFDPDDENWPPLDSLIGDRDKDIKADVQFMLNFAIVGHPKTATTFTMQWLASHSEIQMYEHELHAMQSGRPAELVGLLYNGFPAGRNYKRGYKAPRDVINQKALQSFAQYFPKTKLMVGLRHPVLWFESFYNFRVRHNYTMPPAELLLGKMRDGTHGVCTDESKFHLHLDNLGKTERSTPEELALLTWEKIPPNLPKMTNPVFLYEINQLHDFNQTRADLYRSDLQHFLGLQQGLEPIAISRGSSKSKSKAIDICDVQYRFVRAELMKNAVEASKWIRTYFLQSPDVTVSSREHFVQLLKDWLVDPCYERNAE